MPQKEQRHLGENFPRAHFKFVPLIFRFGQFDFSSANYLEKCEKNLCIKNYTVKDWLKVKKDV